MLTRITYQVVRIAHTGLLLGIVLLIEAYTLVVVLTWGTLWLSPEVALLSCCLIFLFLFLLATPNYAQKLFLTLLSWITFVGARGPHGMPCLRQAFKLQYYRSDPEVVLLEHGSYISFYVWCLLENTPSVVLVGEIRDDK